MRLLAFYLVLLLAQGLLSALLAPLPAPDLFLVALLTLVPRLGPWQLVLAGYGIGLLQDLTGHGVLGLHALALAGAALVTAFLRAQLSQAGFFGRLVGLLGALAGKWLVTAGLLVWLSGSWVSVLEVPTVMLFDVAFTLLAGVWLLPWAEALFERAALLRKELL